MEHKKAKHRVSWGMGGYFPPVRTYGLVNLSGVGYKFKCRDFREWICLFPDLLFTVSLQNLLHLRVLCFICFLLHTHTHTHTPQRKIIVWLILKIYTGTEFNYLILFIYFFILKKKTINKEIVFINCFTFREGGILA